jgi:hypothetical protein
MELVPVQMCQTAIGWSPVQVDSVSHPGQLHMVLVAPTVTKREFVCDCKGFEMRGQCRHQVEALNKVCWWPLVRGHLEQTPAQARVNECPHCFGPTITVMKDPNA